MIYRKTKTVVRLP